MKYTIITVILMHWRAQSSENYPAPKPGVLVDSWVVDWRVPGEAQVEVLWFEAWKQLVSGDSAQISKEKKEELRALLEDDKYRFTAELLYRKVVDAPMIDSVAPTAAAPRK